MKFYVVLTSIVVLLFLVTSPAHSQQDEQSNVDVNVVSLPPVSVSGKKKYYDYLDDSQLSRENFVNTLQLGQGFSVAFELAFAKKSNVLTADGKQAISTLVEALPYLESNTQFKLIISECTSRDLAKRRMWAVKRNLQSYADQVDVDISDIQQVSATSKQQGFDLCRISIANAGKLIGAE